MKNWELKKLGEVCEFVGGSQPPKNDFSFQKKEGYIRLIQIRDYKSDSHIVYIPKNKARRFCNSTDIMIGRYGPPVFQILKGLDGAYNVALMKAVPNEKVLTKEFAFLFLKYSKIQDYVIHLSQRAAGQTGVNKEAIEDYPILLPPLPEQKQIVSILDEAFAAIEKAKEKSEKNLQNAKEIFESYLQSVFENKGEGWEVTTIGESCKLETGGTPSTRNPDFYGGSIKWLVSGDINKKIINDCEGRITELGLRNSNARYLPVNSVLIALNGQGKTRGTVAMLKIKATCNQSLVSIYPKDANTLLPELVFSNLEGRYEEIRKMTGDSGNDRRGLNMPLIKSIQFSYPKNLSEQKNIINKLEALRTEIKKLEGIYQQKLSNLEELKKSILQKAFAGELTSKQISEVA